MVSFSLKNFALAIAPFLVLVKGSSDIIPPTPGTYRIQNAATGFYLDLSGGNTGVYITYPDQYRWNVHRFYTYVGNGTPVITFTLDVPLALNQEWDLNALGGGSFGLQSVQGPFVTTEDNSSPGGPPVLIGTNQGETVFELTGVSGGFNICVVGGGPCLTGPSETSVQVPLEPLSPGSLDQIWVFQAV